METKSFHNTINLDFTTEALMEMKAKKQEELILSVFKNERAYMSPDFVWMTSGLFRMNVPLTSVRRCISNLTDQGVLVKSNRKTMGRYGKPQHTWVYRDYEQDNDQTDFLK